VPDPASTSPVDSELRELGRWLEVPPEPDVASAVRGRLQAVGSVGRPHHRLWRAAAVLVAFVTVAAATVVASPQVRAALLDVLRVGSVEVHSGPAPAGTASPTPSAPVVGLHAASLTAARQSADFPVFVPGPPFQQPDEVLVENGPRPTYVALRYRAGPGRPPASTGGLAVQVDEIAGDSTRFFEKYLDGAGARRVEVGGAPGVWIDGPHELIVVDRAGEVRVEQPRLATRTLVWQRDGVTLRLEADLTLAQALAVATGMR
jgi:hypothetical protein